MGEGDIAGFAIGVEEGRDLPPVRAQFGFEVVGRRCRTARIQFVNERVGYRCVPNEETEFGGEVGEERKTAREFG